MRTLKNIFSFACLCVYLQSYSQPIFKDSLTQEIIPFVEMYGEDGSLFGIGNDKGEVSVDVLTKIKESTLTRVTLYSTYHHPKNISIKVLSNGNSLTISLRPREIFLKEIVIVPPKNYIKVHTYYRSYQINDNIPAYYTDGIVDYFFPLKGSINYLPIDIIQYRSLHNKEEEKSHKNVKKKGPKVWVRNTGVPSIFILPRMDSIKAAFLDADSLNYDIYKKTNNSKRGEVRTDTEKSVTSLKYNYVDVNNPAKVILNPVANLLGYTVNFDNRVHFKYFYKLDNARTWYLPNLLYEKTIEMIRIGHKKGEKLQHIEVIYEVFVLNTEYMDDIHKRKYRKWEPHIFKENSKYNYEYWKDIKNPFYQPLPESVEKAIGSNLEEYK